MKVPYSRAQSELRHMKYQPAHVHPDMKSHPKSPAKEDFLPEPLHAKHDKLEFDLFAASKKTEEK